MGLFRTEEGHAAYLAAYDAMLARWPVPAKSRIVETSLGLTHMLEAGRRDAPPLVLLPAVSVSATEWFANVGELAKQRRLFAVDIVGDAGKSVLKNRPRTPADYARWLAELFAGLGLVRPAVAGHSYGGWLSMALAIHRPEAVGPVVLLAPSSGLAPFHWYMKAFLAVAEKLPFKPGARATLAAQAHKGFVLDATFVHLMEVMTASARTDVLFPGPFSDGDLRRIRSPMLVLIGDLEVLYDPVAAIGRAQRLIPGCRARLVPGCAHLLNMEQPAEIDRAILEFLAGF
jgi:pimeloyl-ACP methyl ester carboxylesterase